MLGGRMPFHGAILQGGASLYAQSRIRKFSDGVQHERRESATIEMELRGTSGPHTWVAGLSEDWFTIRSHDKIWSTLQEDKAKHQGKGKEILSELKSAVALNSLGINIARAIGPAAVP